MRNLKLRRIVFLALCCDLGLIAKRLVSPAANLVTGMLHIPGGISTSFSLMFLAVAAALVPGFGTGILMGAVQSVLALSLGMTGSMGALAPVGYIVPGAVIDIVFLFRKFHLPRNLCMLLACMFSSASASLTANAIVFRLWGPALLLYVLTAMLSGAVCGILGDALAERLRPVICA